MVDQELLQAISTMMDEKIAPIYSRMDKLDSRMDRLDSRMDRLEKEVQDIKTDVLETDRLQDEVDVLTSVVKRHSQDIAELKKAQ